MDELEKEKKKRKKQKQENFFFLCFECKIQKTTRQSKKTFEITTHEENRETDEEEEDEEEVGTARERKKRLCLSSLFRQVWIDLHIMMAKNSGQADGNPPVNITSTQ